MTNATSTPIRQLDTDDLCRVIVERADEMQAVDVIVIDVSGVFDVCDRFVICSAPNPRRVRAITDRIDEAITREAGRPAPAVEGRDALSWVLIDAGDVVVHIFSEEDRQYYRLEKLFADAPRVVVESGAAGAGASPSVIA